LSPAAAAAAAASWSLGDVSGGVSRPSTSCSCSAFWRHCFDQLRLVQTSAQWGWGRTWCQRSPAGLLYAAAKHLLGIPTLLCIPVPGSPSYGISTADGLTVRLDRWQRKANTDSALPGAPGAPRLPDWLLARWCSSSRCSCSM
jgi:hypothetical protein